MSLQKKQNDRRQGMLQKLPSIIMRSSFLKHVAILSGASAMAQLINIASMPVLSRLYSPADFGVLSLFTSVVNLLATASGFRYYLVLPLVRRERYVYALVCLSVCLQISCILFITLLIIMFGHFVSDTPYAVLLPYRYLIPIGVFCIGMYSMAVQWAIKEKCFTLIAKTKLSQVLAACVINIAGALAGLQPLGLLIGNVAGQSCGLSVLFRTLLKKTQTPSYDYTRIKRVALVYRNMCFFDTPASVLNMSGTYLLPLLMAFYFSHATVGSFSMAHSALVLPSAVIGNAVGQVFTQRAGEAHYNGTLPVVTKETFELLARVGIFPILLCSILAPYLFNIFLGSGWSEAGEIAVLLGPWIALNFIYSPISNLYTTLMLQRMGLVFVSVYTVARLGSVILGASSPYQAIMGISISGSLLLLIGITLLLHHAGVHNIHKIFTTILFEICVELLPLLFVLRITKNHSIGSLFTAVALGSTAYLFFLLHHKRISSQSMS